MCVGTNRMFVNISPLCTSLPTSLRVCKLHTHTPSVLRKDAFAYDAFTSTSPTLASDPLSSRSRPGFESTMGT